MTEGHPDKIGDQISDGVLDAVLAEDPDGRVACETLVNTGLVVVSGEISTDAYVDIPEIVRETINEIGYNNADLGFDADSCAVITAIDKQSPDIAQGVDEALEARDRPRRGRRARRRRRRRPGDDVRLRDERDPRADADADLARPQARPAASPRSARTATSPYLRPDGKTQVTVRYRGRPAGRDREGPRSRPSTPTGVDTDTQIRADLWEHVIEPVLPRELYDAAELTPRRTSSSTRPAGS